MAHKLLTPDEFSQKIEETVVKSCHEEVSVRFVVWALLTNRDGYYRQKLSNLRKKFNDMTKERNKYRIWVLKNGRHTSDCYQNRGFERECDCGLFNLKRGF